MEKAVINLAQKYKRIQKDNFKKSLEKLRVNHSESKVQFKKSAIKKVPIGPKSIYKVPTKVIKEVPKCVP